MLFYTACDILAEPKTPTGEMCGNFVSGRWSVENNEARAFLMTMGYKFLMLMVLGLVSCGKPPEKLADKDVFQMHALRSEFGEHGGLSYVSGMEYVNETLYVSDSSNDRVLMLDKDLNYRGEIGRSGEGPGEIQGAGRLCVNNDRLFVSTSGRQSINVYDLNGVHLNAIPRNDFLMLAKFAVVDETIFLSSSTKDKSISAIDFEGNLLYRFSDAQFTNTFEEQRARNNKHLAVMELKDQTILAAVSLTEPLVELFSLDGKLLHTERLEKYPHVAPKAEECRVFYTKAENRGKARSMFDDIAVSGEKLYCLIFSMEPPHKVICLDVTSSSVTFNSFKMLNETVSFTALALGDGNKMYLNDGLGHQIGCFE